FRHVVFVPFVFVPFDADDQDGNDAGTDDLLHECGALDGAVEFGAPESNGPTQAVFVEDFLDVGHLQAPWAAGQDVWLCPAGVFRASVEGELSAVSPPVAWTQDDSGSFDESAFGIAHLAHDCVAPS